MNVAIVYIYAGMVSPMYDFYCERFLRSYHANDPGMDHSTAIVLNGVKRNSSFQCLFSSLKNVQFIEHDNSGYDIGGFQAAAMHTPCDLIVFFGASTFFSRPGWLKRMVESYQKHGPAQYGTMGNRGDVNAKVWPHIRTTAFWMEPKLMNDCPFRVKLPMHRHPFEHGQHCFTSWVKKMGLKSWVVSWTGEYEWEHWDMIPNGFHRGNQSNLIAGDHLCEPPFYSTP